MRLKKYIFFVLIIFVGLNAFAFGGGGGGGGRVSKRYQYGVDTMGIHVDPNNPIVPPDFRDCNSNTETAVIGKCCPNELVYTENNVAQCCDIEGYMVKENACVPMQGYATLAQSGDSYTFTWHQPGYVSGRITEEAEGSWTLFYNAASRSAEVHDFTVDSDGELQEKVWYPNSLDEIEATDIQSYNNGLWQKFLGIKQAYAGLVRQGLATKEWRTIQVIDQCVAEKGSWRFCACGGTLAKVSGQWTCTCPDGGSGGNLGTGSICCKNGYALNQENGKYDRIDWESIRSCGCPDGMIKLESAGICCTEDGASLGDGAGLEENDPRCGCEAMGKQFISYLTNGWSGEWKEVCCPKDASVADPEGNCCGANEELFWKDGKIQCGTCAGGVTASWISGEYKGSICCPAGSSYATDENGCCSEEKDGKKVCAQASSPDCPKGYELNQETKECEVAYTCAEGEAYVRGYTLLEEPVFECCDGELETRPDGWQVCCKEGYKWSYGRSSVDGYCGCPKGGEASAIDRTYCCKEGYAYSTSSGEQGSYREVNGYCGCPDGGVASEYLGLVCCKNGLRWNQVKKEYMDVDGYCGACPEGGERGKTRPGECCKNGLKWFMNKYELLNIEECGCPEGVEPIEVEGRTYCCKNGYEWNDVDKEYNKVTGACGECPAGTVASTKRPEVCCKDGYVYSTGFVEEDVCGCPLGGELTEGNPLKPWICCKNGYAWNGTNYSGVNSSCGCPNGGEASEARDGTCCKGGYGLNKGTMEYDVIDGSCGYCPGNGVVANIGEEKPVCCEEGYRWNPQTNAYDWRAKQCPCVDGGERKYSQGGGVETRCCKNGWAFNERDFAYTGLSFDHCGCPVGYEYEEEANNCVSICAEGYEYIEAENRCVKKIAS